MNALTVESIRWAVGRVSEHMQSSSDELNALDAALGDGDLGITLTRALARLMEDLPSLPDDVGKALSGCAQAFTKVSASTYGTLLATGLFAAGRLTRGRNAAPWTEIGPLLEAARIAMSDRGKGQLGDKTVLDAIEAARQATDGLDQPAAIPAAADRAIDAVMHEFRDRPFRQGRARIFGAKGTWYGGVQADCGESSRGQSHERGCGPMVLLKYRHRVLALLFTLSAIAYLDRVCVFVAGLRMQADLHISPEHWWLGGGSLRDRLRRLRDSQRSASLDLHGTASTY